MTKIVGVNDLFPYIRFLFHIFRSVLYPQDHRDRMQKIYETYFCLEAIGHYRQYNEVVSKQNMNSGIFAYVYIVILANTSGLLNTITSGAL